ncbi:MAG: 50S ribosomal protein L11 methyltransferase [Chloroflexi bacterium]|nr:50S ribosomal protein L11 methyltransferase [Chloroflexota bacterium]
MSRLLELALPIFTTESGHEAVSSSMAELETFAQGDAAIELSGFGPYGETDHAHIKVRVYLREEQGQATGIAALNRRLQALPSSEIVGELQLRRWQADEWADVWKEHYRPLRIGEHLIISPTWETPTIVTGDHVVWLDPGMAFGTGTHPSTQLILQLLERHLSPGDSMLDVGTGSGILAVAAMKLGASHVLATDIDPEAVATAEDNIKLNEVEKGVQIVRDSVPISGAYELVCANILADVIANLLLHQNLADRLTCHGILLLSGIIESRRHVVELALAASGLSLLDSVRDGDWVALAVHRA